MALRLARSLWNNELGAEGVSALASILNTTKITHLECAAAPEAFIFCQRPLVSFVSFLTNPLTRLPTLSRPLLSRAHLTPLRPPIRSLQLNRLSNKIKKAVRDAAGSGVSITL